MIEPMIESTTRYRRLARLRSGFESVCTATSTTNDVDFCSIRLTCIHSRALIRVTFQNSWHTSALRHIAAA
jgi:hypothetical protein